MSAKKEAEARAEREAAEQEEALPAYVEFDASAAPQVVVESAPASPPTTVIATASNASVPATINVQLTAASEPPPKSATPSIVSPVGPSKEDESAPPPAYLVIDPSPVSSPACSSAAEPVLLRQSSGLRQGQLQSWLQQQSLPPLRSQSRSQSRSPYYTIAIPQVDTTATAPLLSAYPPSLLGYGITAETWRSFLSTMSAFLSANASDKAVLRAADVGRALAENPKRFGKDTLEHAKAVGRGIKANAKEGNFLGAAFGVVGGGVSLPLGAALRAVGAVMSLPATAVRAAAQKPQTPRERAAAHAAAANKKWLLRRGLEARLLDSRELGALVGVDTPTLYDAARLSAGRGASVRSKVGEFLTPLDVEAEVQLELWDETLWLVVLRCEVVPPESKSDVWEGEAEEEAMKEDVMDQGAMEKENKREEGGEKGKEKERV